MIKALVLMMAFLNPSQKDVDLAEKLYRNNITYERIYFPKTRFFIDIDNVDGHKVIFYHDTPHYEQGIVSVDGRLFYHDFSIPWDGIEFPIRR